MSTPDPRPRRRRSSTQDVPADQPQHVDPPQPQTGELLPPAEPAATSTALTLPERARAAIGLVEIETKLQELAASTATITAITNADGREQVHASAMALKQQRIAIEQAGKQARDDANKFAGEVIVQQNKLIELISPEEKRLLALRDEWDKARAEEKRQKAEADRKRQQAIQQRIQDMRDRVAEAAGHSAAEIDAAIRDFTTVVVDESFGEFKAVAEQAHANVLARLRSMHAERVRFEAQQEQLRVQREQQEAEQAKRKAELDAEIARQRAERELTATRMKAITAIQRLPIVATTGRSPDRKPGTRECIVDTLAEARAFTVTESDFGSLTDSALGARAAAVEQIEYLLQRFDEQAAERVRREEQDRQQREAQERQRAEEQRMQAQRDALEAEQRRQQEQREREESELRARREQLDSEQAELLQRQQVSVHPAIEAEVGDAAVVPATASPSVATEEFVPSAIELTAVIAHEYGRSQAVAESWLRARFAA